MSTAAPFWGVHPRLLHDLAWGDEVTHALREGTDAALLQFCDHKMAVVVERQVHAANHVICI